MKNIAFILVLLLLAACQEGNRIEPEPIDNTYTPVNNPANTEFGIPTDADSSDDFLIYRHSYTMSYNGNLNAANWVSWNLNRNWFGNTGRYDKFLDDPALPEEFSNLNTSFYSGSGYHRGHIVRSYDRSDNWENNRETYYLTNIYPMRSGLNEGPWSAMELDIQGKIYDYDKEFYIIAGGIFRSGKKISSIISVPDSCWKIAVALDRGQGLEDAGDKTQVFAAIMPNINGIEMFDWSQYKTTVDAIEESTGYDFLSALPDSLEAVLEVK